MARQPVRNADLEIDVALQLLIRVRELWTKPIDGTMLSLEEMATNRLALRLREYANELLENNGQPAQEICVKASHDLLNGNGHHADSLEYASRD